ncbi:MAG: hypothetical protein LUG57_03770 [Oscillospiraceae bacterium]|nr:hypothetical protein [Oscillospiraceae bacterium]
MRKALALLLAAALALSAAGCSTFFDKEYYASEEYQAQEQEAEEGDAIGSISSYAALKRAIATLVEEHVESAQLQFLNYEGTISTDISTACWEVKSSTALGAFAVDYISYDLSRIVSYYQAEIYITYKRSESQMAALEDIGTAGALAERLGQVLRGSETYLVLELSSTSVTAETVLDYLETVYYTDPLACPVLPEAEVDFYPESGVDRIAEITLDYGLDSQELSDRREALTQAVEEITAAVLRGETATGEITEEETEAETGAEEETETASGEPEAEPGEADALYALCLYLTEGCVCDETAGSTAWDALVNGTADSQGMAMALEALCQALDMECLVLAGRMDTQEHYWNIVFIDGQSYHVDAANWDCLGESVFLVGDEALWGAYWWDTSEYPVCPEGYGYFGAEEPETETETETESEAETQGETESEAGTD